MTDVHGLIKIVTSAAGGTGCAAAAGVDGVDVAADDPGGTGEAGVAVSKHRPNASTSSALGIPHQ